MRQHINVNNNPLYKNKRTRTQSNSSNILYHYRNNSEIDLLEFCKEIALEAENKVNYSINESYSEIDESYNELNALLESNIISVAFYEKYLEETGQPLSLNESEELYDKLFERRSSWGSSSWGKEPRHDFGGWLLSAPGKLLSGAGGIFGALMKALKGIGLGLLGLTAFFLYKALHAGDAKKVLKQLNTAVAGAIFGWGKRPANARDGKDPAKKVADRNNYVISLEDAADQNLSERRIKEIDGSYVAIMREEFDAMRMGLTKLHETLYGTSPEAYSKRLPSSMQIKDYDSTTGFSGSGDKKKSGNFFTNLFKGESVNEADEETQKSPNRNLGILSPIILYDKFEDTPVAIYKSSILYDFTPTTSQSIEVTPGILSIILAKIRYGLNSDSAEDCRKMLSLIRNLLDPYLAEFINPKASDIEEVLPEAFILWLVNFREKQHEEKTPEKEANSYMRDEMARLGVKNKSDEENPLDSNSQFSMNAEKEGVFDSFNYSEYEFDLALFESGNARDRRKLARQKARETRQNGVVPQTNNRNLPAIINNPKDQEREQGSTKQEDNNQSNDYSNFDNRTTLDLNIREKKTVEQIPLTGEASKYIEKNKLDNFAFVAYDENDNVIKNYKKPKVKVEKDPNSGNLNLVVYFDESKQLEGVDQLRKHSGSELYYSIFAGHLNEAPEKYVNVSKGKLIIDIPEEKEAEQKPIALGSDNKEEEKTNSSSKTLDFEVDKKEEERVDNSNNNSENNSETLDFETDKEENKDKKEKEEKSKEDLQDEIARNYKEEWKELHKKKDIPYRESVTPKKFRYYIPRVSNDALTNCIYLYAMFMSTYSDVKISDNLEKVINSRVNITDKTVEKYQDMLGRDYGDNRSSTGQFQTDQQSLLRGQQGDDEFSNNVTDTSSLMDAVLKSNSEKGDTYFSKELIKKFEGIKNSHDKTITAAIDAYEKSNSADFMEKLGLKRQKGNLSDMKDSSKKLASAGKLRSLWAAKLNLFDKGADNYVSEFYSSDFWLDANKYINQQFRPYLKILLLDTDKSSLNSVFTRYKDEIQLSQLDRNRGGASVELLDSILGYVARAIPLPDCLFK